jgi:hypothetical protein
MLKEMRGQSQSMQLIAHKHCARRFRVEVPLDIRVSRFDWMYDGLAAHITPTPRHTEYVYTRGTFQFSLKDCSAVLGDLDYSPSVEAYSTAGDFFVVAPPPGYLLRPLCLRGNITMGRYR